MRFRSNDRTEYAYNQRQLFIFKFERQEDVSLIAFFEKSSRRINKIYNYSYFGHYCYCLKCENGDYVICHENEVHFRQDASRSSVYGYLKELAEQHIVGKPDEKGARLSDKYAWSAIRQDSLMASYCLGGEDVRRVSSEPFLIFPFGCNRSQYTAVRTALEKNVSIIEGPPGTGKTQTILNIIANLVVTGKTVEVVSSNNSAVENVLEKLEKDEYDLSFLVAKLGKNENKLLFNSSQPTTIPPVDAWGMDAASSERLKADIKSISGHLGEFFDAQERVKVLEEKIAELDYQIRLSGKKRRIPARWEMSRRPSEKLFTFHTRLDEWVALSWFARFKTRLTSFRLGYGFHLPSLETVMWDAVNIYVAELAVERNEKKRLIDQILPRYKAFVADSLRYLKAVVYERFKVYRGRQTCFDATMLRKDPDLTNAFLKRYPVVLSTTFSATSNIHQGHLFDLLIMDEASQADIATGALALNVSRRAVIVGDDKQLPNVVDKEHRPVMDAIFRRSGLPKAYGYCDNSFLSSFKLVFKNAPVTLLREHYRCEPRIIGYCNRQFYSDRLIIMTPRMEGKSITVIESGEGRRKIGMANLRQAEEVVEEVRNLLNNYKDIGVITPYHQQRELIQSLLNQNKIQGIMVNTIHAFQGKENDAIIVSLVDDCTDNPFTDDPHLLNVAVSRAKKHFTLVVTGNEKADGNTKALVDYIKYLGGEEGSKVISVFDALFGPFSEARKKLITGPSEYASENLMYNQLIEILSLPLYSNLECLFQYPLRLLIPEWVELSAEETRYVNNPWTCVDFLLYDRTSRWPKLVIEVDGVAFHKKGSVQGGRDELKNSVLGKAGVRILRLSTGGSNEREKITACLNRTD